MDIRHLHFTDAKGRCPTVIVVICFHIERGAQHFHLIVVDFNVKRTLCIGLYLEKGFAFQLHATGIAIETGRVFQFRHSIQPHFCAVCQSQGIFTTAGCTDQMLRNRHRILVGAGIIYRIAGNDDLFLFAFQCFLHIRQEFHSRTVCQHQLGTSDSRFDFFNGFCYTRLRFRPGKE